MLVTAMVTPFDTRGAVDGERAGELAAFQLEHGAAQVLLAGTTGEGAALDEADLARLLDAVLEVAPADRIMLALGSGHEPARVARGRLALERGVRDLLVVDCPYAGPSSSSLRTHWHAPVAKALPDGRLFIYTVPGRTASELLPEDLARLAEDHANVVGCKDATGSMQRMTRVRALLGNGFLLLCGDDGLAVDALTDPEVRAHGLCSVASNLAPEAMSQLVRAARSGGDVSGYEPRLASLWGLVSVTCEEQVELRGQVHTVVQQARNPAPLKAALELLGVGVGACRPPHGPLGPRARAAVREQLAAVDDDLLAPLVARFGDPAHAMSGAAIVVPASGATVVDAAACQGDIA